MRPAASAPTHPPPTSSSTRSPSSCTCRRTARCRLPFRATSIRPACPPAVRSSISRRRCPIPGSDRASCHGASGPAGMTMAGRFALVAPITSAGIVLSQPPIRTTPSTGYDRSASSASIARRLRYIMVLGFMYVSPSVMTGISIGKPPACQMPRLTSSARTRKCVWHGFASLHVFRMAMTGLPEMSSTLNPACLARERCPNDRRSSLPNHRWLRSSVG